jgi:hypothetical protein
MNENIIAWNATNMITIILMAAIGFFIIGIAQKWYAGRGTSAPTSSA